MAIIQSFFGPDIPSECSKCKQSKGCKNPFMTYKGLGRQKILIVGGWPSAEEDRTGVFYSGTSGKLFKQKLRLLGYDLDKDFWYTKGVSCTSAKPPTKTVIKNCRHRVNKLIADLKPKAVFLLGNVGIDSVIGEWVHIASATSLSGLQIPLHDMNCWAFPLMAPEITLGNNRDKNAQEYFSFVFKKALDACKKLPKLEQVNFMDKIDILTDPDDIIQSIQDIIHDEEPSAFDIETSGLNPYDTEDGKSHRIFTMAISNKHSTIAFPIDYPGAYKYDEDYEDVCDAVYAYLESEKCPKIAHRTEFENKWCTVLLDADVKNMHWCTKTTQHIVDNRIGITGLKHQAFVRWGIKDYDTTSSMYIKSGKNTIFNKMHKMPLMEQLLYVGADAFLTYKLYKEQKEELKSLDTQRFFNDVVNMFNEMSINGICIDTDFYEREKKELEEDIKYIFEDLFSSQEIISYENKYGDITFTSNDDIRQLFFTHLGCKSEKETTNGQASVDKTALEKTGHWIAKELLRIRKLLKIKDTYIAQFMREARDGKIHPSFNVFVARSLRSSSQNPNFQNIPKRDELSKYITRSGLKPSPGNRLIELDFSGAEVITSAAYNKDPNLIKYLIDDKTDMHRDNAADVWKTTPDNVSKKVRFFAKNCWTFPQFYGDYYGSCAKALWENNKEVLEDGKTCLEHLKELKLGTFKKFTEHCKKAEKIMWGTRFKVYDQWRKNSQIEYRKNFTVKTYFDFEFIGYMDWKQVANYPIQGTSFHLLLKVLLKMNNWLKEKKMKTKLVGQIHDSGFFDSPDNEYQKVIKQFQKYTDMLYDEYEWLEVRMEADADISLIDGNFSNMFTFSWDKPIEEQERKAIQKWNKIEDKLFNN